MALGERIKECRQNAGLSQEKVAELVGVSRQAVTKWEVNQSAPNTENLFKLAEIFGTTVDMLLDSNDSNKQSSAEQIYYLYKMEEEKKIANKKRKTKKYISIALVVALVLGCILGSVIYIRNLPVDYDAGACGGGYATFIFDKYSEELTEKYVSGMIDNSNISSAKAVRGTQEAEWEDQTLFLQFDIQYEHSTQGTVTERVRFIGERTWFDTYDWSGAIIDGGTTLTE
ncbi:MAG: helix-turn-helix transcriptional regulator [Tyzzerella sp.]|nr:helix-turn-helix transcriptional regulator [Tyzzerella sp.]